MGTLAQQITEYTAGLPEGTPLMAKGLLHLGNRAAVDQALSRMARRGALLRIERGIYAVPVPTRFGNRAPAASALIEGLARQRGETVVPHGAAAANELGLTTQVPVRAVYLTSGRSRLLTLGAQVIEFRHAPRWQLALAGRHAGKVLRALTWLGPQHANEAIAKLRARLSASDLAEVASSRGQLPTWMAKEVSTLLQH